MQGSSRGVNIDAKVKEKYSASKEDGSFVGGAVVVGTKSFADKWNKDCRLMGNTNQWNTKRTAASVAQRKCGRRIALAEQTKGVCARVSP